MRIALVGANGQLGTDLRACLTGDVVPLTHADVDIADADRVESALGKIEPECVINAAAYNFVDRAEDEPEIAYSVNALGPRNLARFCGARDILLLHISTDYVFGLDRTRRTPYCETDVPGPLGAYTVSKLAGEHFVRCHCPRHFIVRTCGLYGRAAGRKGNFVETMLRLAAERDELTIVDDQRCTPTSTADLARAIAALIHSNGHGVYHVTNGGSATWYEFAREIFRLAGTNVKVRPISSDQFPTKARRPKYSVLDNGKLAAETGITLRPWQEALASYLEGGGLSGELRVES